MLGRRRARRRAVQRSLPHRATPWRYSRLGGQTCAERPPCEAPPKSARGARAGAPPPRRGTMGLPRKVCCSIAFLVFLGSLAVMYRTWPAVSGRGPRPGLAPSPAAQLSQGGAAIEKKQQGLGAEAQAKGGGGASEREKQASQQKEMATADPPPPPDPLVCHSELRHDKDIFGHDVGSKKARDAGHCCVLCQDLPRCGAFTFVVRPPPPLPFGRFLQQASCCRMRRGTRAGSRGESARSVTSRTTPAASPGSCGRTQPRRRPRAGGGAATPRARRRPSRRPRLTRSSSGSALASVR